MGVIDRVKNICLTPATEWPVIASETSPSGTIVTGYLLPLAAVSAAAGFVGGSVIGRTLPFLGTYRVPFATGLAGALVTIVMTIVGVFLISAVVNALAPTFGATKDSAQAFKVVAYSVTPGLAAGILQVLPALSILVALAGLYGIYLMYLGLPRLMQCPPDKAVGYTATVVLCAIVVGIVFGAVVAAVTGVGSMMGMGGFGMGAPATVQTDPNSPLGRLEEMGRAMEESAKRAEAAAGRGDTAAAASEAIGGLGALLGGGARVEPMAADELRTFMPESFGGLSRRSSSAERTEFGLAVSRAEGRFGDGNATDITVEVVDTGGLAGLMGVAAWMNVQSEREDDDGYERTRREGNRMIHEKSSRSGDNEFATVVGERFLVSAKGRGLNVGQLRAGVSGLDLSRLESVASTAKPQ
jgi:hypothetical protein